MWVCGLFKLLLLISLKTSLGINIPANLKTNLVAYYAFDGDLTDASGNGHTGNGYGTVTYGTDRNLVASKCLNLDGTTTYVEVTTGSTAFDFSNAMSVSFWAKPSATQTASATYFDHSTLNGGHAVTAGWIFQLPSTNPSEITFSFMNTTTLEQATTPTTITAAAWNHIVFSKSGTSLTIYINGVASLAAFTHYGISVATGRQLMIGAENYGQNTPSTSAVNKFTGCLDDVAFYSRALTADEVFQLYDITAPTSQPSSQPSERPSGKPSRAPSSQPSSKPSGKPSSQPTRNPTDQPTSKPSRTPSGQPTSQPSAQPASYPTSGPTGQPTSRPSRSPSSKPSTQPSTQPTSRPSSVPSSQPSSQPTNRSIHLRDTFKTAHSIGTVLIENDRPRRTT